MNKRNLVGMPGHVRQQSRNRLAALPGWRKRPGRFHKIAVLSLKGDFPFRARQRRAIVFFKRRFVVPQIHVRGRAGTENLQDLFRFWRVMLNALGGFKLCAEQVCQRHACQTGRGGAQKMAAS